MLNLFPMPNYTDPSDPNNLAELSRRSAISKFKSHRIDARVDFALEPQGQPLRELRAARAAATRTRAGCFPEVIADNVDDTSWMASLNYARIFTPNLTNEVVVAYGKGKLCLPDQDSVDYMHQTDTLRAKYFQNLGSGAGPGALRDVHRRLLRLRRVRGLLRRQPELPGLEQPELGQGRATRSRPASTSSGRKRWTSTTSATWASTNSSPARAASTAAWAATAWPASCSGIPSFMQQRYNLTDGDDALNFVMPYWGFYVEDKWQMNSKWTLSAGLRYDLGIQTYSGNRYGNAVVDMSYDGWQLAIPGRAAGPRSPLSARRQEQLRAAASAWPTSRRPGWVLRGGYGIFYDLGVTNTAASRARRRRSAGCRATSATSTDNFRFDVPDDVPVMGLDDVFPAPATLRGRHLPDQHRARHGVLRLPGGRAATSTSHRAPRRTTTASSLATEKQFGATHRGFGLLHGQPGTRAALLR